MTSEIIDPIKIQLTFPDGTTKVLPEKGQHIDTFSIKCSDDRERQIEFVPKFPKNEW